MDGLKLVDTLNGSTLETFPLNAISRWAVRDKDTFLFWSAKDAASGVAGGKQRQTELKGSARDVSGILDTITAACMQVRSIPAIPPSLSLIKHPARRWLPRFPKISRRKPVRGQDRHGRKRRRMPVR